MGPLSVIRPGKFECGSTKSTHTNYIALGILNASQMLAEFVRNDTFLWIVGIDKAHFVPDLGPRARARIEGDMNCGIAVGNKGELDINIFLDES